MSVPLLTTKLCPPLVRSGLVSRPRLLSRLNEGLSRKLTLVSAPAGFGKTTLVAAWLAEVDWPSAWLSLDEGDNDPSRFTAYLLAALQQIDPRIGQSAQAMLQSPQPPPAEALITVTINDMASAEQPFVLILDDYHVLHSLPIHQLLSFLLDHQPAHVHLVLASREDPPLPLSRLRARAQVAEIRQADLQFTAQETAAFLRETMSLSLSDAHLDALYQRTEGWIAGLQLAALSVQNSPDVDKLVDSFASSNRYVLDYLIEEVVQQQAAEIQGFMQETSVLERLSAPLCDAVTGREDSQQRLLALERGNLFLVPLDTSRQWYRYHRLFVDLLRHRLQTAAPQKASELHRRASDWYNGAGYPGDAIHHALAARDWERAAELVTSASGDMMQRGELVTLMGWCQAIPEDEMCARPSLCIEYCWALILTGQLDAAEQYLAQLEQMGQHAPTLLGSVRAAQVQIARGRGQDERTIELAEEALSLLDEDDLNGRSVVNVNLGIAYWEGGQLAQAEKALTETVRTAQASGNHYAGLVAVGFLGAVQASWGNLHRAADMYRQGIQSGQNMPPVALDHNQLGELLYEWNDLEASQHHIQRGLDMTQRSANLEIASGGYRTLARLQCARGEDAALQETMAQIQQMVHGRDLAPQTRSRLASFFVEIALRQGDLHTAVRWAEQATEAADASPYYPHLGLTPARILIAQGHKRDAAALLATCAQKATEEGWQYGLVVVRALQSLAAPDLDEALRYLAEALALAAPEGYVRTFVDLGEPMQALLREAARKEIESAYVERLLVAFGPETPEDAIAARGHPSLVEPLSAREMQALALLADGKTNQEIAQTMYVSINTVKTHLKNVYGKLGVNNRRQAASRASALDLLS